MEKLIKIVFVIALLLFFSPVPSLGQEDMKAKPYNVLLNSPNVASLGEYGNIPVSNYTGIPNVDIPIYEIDLDGMKIPISLSYHASGVRVQQEASWVGLNWSLRAGGQIIKTIRNEEDHKVTFYDERVVYGYYEARNMFKQYIDEESPFPNLIRTGNFGTDGMTCANFVNLMLQSDTEPDLYSYNFCNYTGKMITGAEDYQPPGHGNIKKGLLLSPKEHLDFSFDVNSWMAKDTKGYKYYFDTWETTTTIWGPFSVVHSSFLSSEAAQPNHQWLKNNILNQGNNSSFVSAWLLDSIVSPFGNKVVFEYDSEGIEIPFNLTEKASYITSNEGSIPGGPPASYPPRDYVVSGSSMTQRILKKITWDGGKIIFETTARNDLMSADATSPSKLSGIKVYNRDQLLIRDFSLEHIYHGSSFTQSPAYRQRLLLSKLKENKSNAEHTFIYNMGELPSKNSLNTDLWGYYNGIKGAPPAYSPNESIYKLYTIPSSYITKYTTGEYIPIIGVNKDSDSLSLFRGMLQSITYPTGGSTHFEFEPHRISYTNISPNPGEDLYHDYLFVASIGTTPAIQNTEELYYPFTIDQECTKGLLSMSYSTLSPQPPPDFDLYDPQFTVAIQKLENGVYTNVPFNIGAIYSRSTLYNVEISPEGKDETRVLTTTMPSGQYRMVVVRDQYFRDYFYFSATLKMYMAIPNEIVQDSSVMVGGVRIKKFTNIIGDKEEVTEFKYLSPDGKSSGKLMSTPFFHALAKRRFEDWYPSPITPYRYEEIYERFSTNSFLEQAYTAQGSHIGYSDVQVYKQGEDGFTNYSYLNSPSGAYHQNLIRFPVINSEFNGLLKKTTYYNASRDSVKTESFFYDYLADGRRYYAFAKDEEQLLNCDFWDPLDFRSAVASYCIPSFLTKLREKKTVEYLPGGKKMETSTHYDYEPTYQLPVSVQTTSSENVPLKTITKYPFDYTDAVNRGMVAKSLIGIPIEQISLVDRTVVSSDKILFKDTLGMFLPSKIFDLKVNEFADINNYQSGYVEKMQLSSYNQKGKPGVINKDDVNTVYLWSYGSLYPIAEIKNATYTQVAGAVQRVFGMGIPQLASASAPNHNALRSLRFDSGLSDAQVTIFSYTPLLGITSETDPAGMTTFYYYDNAGRLFQVKDYNNNLLKEYKYNYAQ